MTNYLFRAYMLAPAAYKNSLNKIFLKHGYGPDTFSVGLSASGSAPAQAYHANCPIHRSDIAAIKRMANDFPKMWIWIRVCTKYVQDQGDRQLARLVTNFELEPYQDKNWQTRDKAYIRVSRTPINIDTAITWINNNAVPSVSLQVIGQG